MVKSAGRIAFQRDLMLDARSRTLAHRVGSRWSREAIPISAQAGQSGYIIRQRASQAREIFKNLG
jgi:hypothetical protein